jgi:hypothetical protein
MMRHATDAAAATDKGAVIAGAVVDGIRAARIVLPSPDTIERVGLAGRARARKLATDTLIAPLTAEQITGLDALLVNDPALKRSPLAWLRDVPEAPGANNLNEIIERLTYVHSIPNLLTASTSTGSGSWCEKVPSRRPSCSATIAYAAAAPR